VTSFVHGTGPVEETSLNTESAKVKGSSATGVKQPAPDYPRPKQPGVKVPGAIRTKGGSI
jgi:hypothetical protein